MWLGKGSAKDLRVGKFSIALKTRSTVSESNGQRENARLQVSEFLAVDPMKAAYWKTPRPLATLGPSDDTANGLPLLNNSTTQLNEIEYDSYIDGDLLEHGSQ